MPAVPASSGVGHGRSSGSAERKPWACREQMGPSDMSEHGLSCGAAEKLKQCYLGFVEVPKASHEKDFSDAHTPWPNLSHASRTRGQNGGQQP